MRGFKPLTITADMVVDTNLFDVAPAAYSAGTTYALDAYASVAGTLGEILIYKSLQASNTGHTPASSPTWWVYVSSTYEEFVRGTTPNELGYRVRDPVTNYIYEAVTDYSSNQPLDVSKNPVWLEVSTSSDLQAPDYNPLTTYALGALVYAYEVAVISPAPPVPVIIDAGIYQSNIAGNLGNHPTLTSAWNFVGLTPPTRITEVSYAIGDVVKSSDGKFYKALMDTNARCPFDNRALWIPVGPSNRTAMFDGEIAAASKAMQTLNVTVASGIIDTVGLMGAYGGTVTCTVRDGLGGTVVYEETKGLSGNIVADWWDFIYADPEFPRKKAVFENIPPYVDSHVTIAVEGDAEVRIGALLMGQQKSLGIGAKYGASVQLVDLSRTEANAFGDIKFIQGRYYERLDLNVMLRKVDFNRVHLELTDMRGQPWFLVVSDDPDLSEALLMYGFYKDYRNVIDYPGMTLYSLQFEGLVSE